MSDSQGQVSNHSAVSIGLLADHPYLIPEVGQIRWMEWGHPPEPESLDWWVDMTGHEAGREALPVTWVAVDDIGRAVGAVGLAVFDIEELHDRSPWVIGMIVADPYRARGIGGKLMGTLEAWAHQHGYRQLWVATGQAAGFYQQCGWELAELINRLSGETASILTKLV